MSGSDLSDLLEGPPRKAKPGIVQVWVDSLPQEQQANFYLLLADPRWKTRVLWTELRERGAPFQKDAFHTYRAEWLKQRNLDD